MYTMANFGVSYVAPIMMFVLAPLHHQTPFPYIRNGLLLQEPARALGRHIFIHVY